MVTSFKHNNDVRDQLVANMRTVCGCSFLIFPTDWYGYVRLRVFFICIVVRQGNPIPGPE